jgi:hypothetical protein
MQNLKIYKNVRLGKIRPVVQYIMLWQSDLTLLLWLLYQVTSMFRHTYF